MLPVIALVGRPNVGKSTLFNRLTRFRDALVADFAGLTRDRKYGEAEWSEQRFICIDTGGLSGAEEGIDGVMAEQSLLAIQEANVILFLVDCRAGLNAFDQTIANYLRTVGKKTFIVANKVDGHNQDVVIAPFYEMGLGDIHPITATHGHGVSRLMQEVIKEFSKMGLEAPTLPKEASIGANDDEQDNNQKNSAKGIKIAVVGRPNVGKSSLVNRLLGEDRVVVYDMPGTTRDSIYINYERRGKTYTIIDTAGIRRRKSIKLTIEKFSIVKTLQAVEDANVVVLLLDASEGIVDQDLHLIGHVIDTGRAFVVALNKWDGLEQEFKQYVKNELGRRLRFIDFADIHFISALHGTGVGHLYDSIEKAYASATDQFSTNHLTNILQMAVTEHQPPIVRGHRIKLRYAHAGGHNPPIIVIHGNQTSDIPNHYIRYLEKTFRRALDLHGTPIRLQFKTSDNPYRKTHLTDRQKTRQRRLKISQSFKTVKKRNR
ncbi:ribosome biogenesis GTPase Der [Candidatus Endobugula sertula]|uniref:GTPase Der n=1 Tax=Candidatus Endobugula sertula TaxID=62101 RepID=A0A1D2QLQ2_9GAMM|nr:ribosome biogenesis GTPase Der [Candidatus Endobugula sertula]